MSEAATEVLELRAKLAAAEVRLAGQPPPPEEDPSIDAENYQVADEMVMLKVRDASGAWHFRDFYRGAVLPAEDVEPESLKHHLRTQQIVDADSLVAAYLGPAGTPVPGEPPNVPVGEAATVDQGARLERIEAALENADNQATGPTGTTERYPEGDPNDSWTVPQLQGYAEDNEVDLSGATKKAEILEKIGQARDES